MTFFLFIYIVIIFPENLYLQSFCFWYNITEVGFIITAVADSKSCGSSIFMYQRGGEDLLTEEAKKLLAEYQREYRKKHPGKNAEYQRKYRKRHPEKIKQNRDNYWNRLAEKQKEREQSINGSTQKKQEKAN